MVRGAYSVETKLACIEMKKAGKSNKVIMDTLSIKNASQARNWLRWYQNDDCTVSTNPWGNNILMVMG